MRAITSCEASECFGIGVNVMPRADQASRVLGRQASTSKMRSGNTNQNFIRLFKNNDQNLSSLVPTS